MYLGHTFWFSEEWQVLLFDVQHYNFAFAV